MERQKRKKKLTGCAILIAVTVLLLCAAPWGYMGLMESSDNAHPPADAPADLCGVVGDDLAGTLVPNAVRVPDAVYSRGPDAACAWSTGEPQTGAYGFLSARILRYGQVAWHSGTSRADDSFGEDCDALVSNGEGTGLGGLGDEACAATQEADSGGTASADLVVRRGADLVWVRYFVNPGADVDVGRRVADVAARVLANV